MMNISESESDDDGPRDVLVMCKTCRCLYPLEMFIGKSNSERTKNCLSCRDKAKKYRETYHLKHPEAASRSMAKYNATPKAKAKNARYAKTPKARAKKLRHKATERYAQTTAKYIDSGRKQEVRSAEYERTHSDPGRHLEHAIGTKIGLMLNGRRKSSNTVMSNSEFASREDLCHHFESQFESWMNWDNHGKALVDGPRHWNIGHRIARALYDANDDEDVRRCWSKKNLFPQDAFENIALQTKLPSNNVLQSMKECWPTAWNGVVPEFGHAGMVRNGE